MLSLKARIRSGYLIAFILLLISYVFIFVTIRKLQTESDRVAHSYTVLNKLETIKAEIVDAETGLRGYLLTKDVRFLKPYNSGSKNVSAIEQDLQKLVADNKAQQQSLDSLTGYMSQRLGFMAEALTQFQTNGFIVSDEMRAKREVTKASMDNIRHMIITMKSREETLISNRKTELSNFFSSTEIITIVSLIIALITIFYSVVTYQNESRAKDKADKNAKKYREDLETNVNELKEANAELKELKNMEKFASTGRIARTIAHEVRNPLTNIALAAEQLQEMAIHNADSSVLLDMIGRNANRINQLVSDLLNATRFVQLEFKEVDINELVEATLLMAKDRIDLNNIKVERKFGTNLPKVSLDWDKIKLALLNIIVNAIEAMEKNTGVLTITTYTQGQKCFIAVKDNGTGMDEDTLQKLFEPYFTGKPKGNGLGLTNTQNIILNHQGNIKVQSKLGQGSTLTIMLNTNGIQ